MADDREGRALKKGAGKRSAGHELSAEERALWEQAARALKPLKGKPRVHGRGAEEAPPSAPRAPEKPVAHRKGAAPAGPTAKTAAPLGAPPLADLDRRKARRIGSGKIEIEGRIDLHGLRQAEAHSALRRFLARSHAAGRRWVLVITGKGAPLRRGEDEDDLVGVREGERGVLKRNVPRWLEEPELRAIVVGYTTAAIRHGGEGALYVQLRRKDR